MSSTLKKFFDVPASTTQKGPHASARSHNNGRPKRKYSDDVLDVQEFCTGCFQQLKLRRKSVMIQTVHKVQISQVQYAIKSPDVLAIVQQAVDVPVPQISEETVERTKQQRTVA